MIKTIILIIAISLSFAGCVDTQKNITLGQNSVLENSAELIAKVSSQLKRKGINDTVKSFAFFHMKKNFHRQ